MEKKYFGTDGIRGKVGQSPITPDWCVHLGWAIGRYFLNNNANVVVDGNDKVGAAIFGQRYSKISCKSCHIDNSTESTEKIIEVSKCRCFYFC